MTNKKWVIKAYAKKGLSESNYEKVSEEIRPLEDGEILVRNRLISIDPTNRVWMNDQDTYLPRLQKGEVMRALCIGEIVDSRDESMLVGQTVTGLFGWQTHVICKPGDADLLPDIDGLPIDAHFGLFGHIGLAAYHGFYKTVDTSIPGTMFVSGAAGAVGSLVGQIAKANGWNVVGCAGKDHKIEELITYFGFDGAINYNIDRDKFRSEMKDKFPLGVDVYFDNVGGWILDETLEHMKDFGSIVGCGMISQYEGNDHVFKNLELLVTKRLNYKGFVCLDHMDELTQVYEELHQLHQQGKLKYKVDIIEDGFDGLPEAPSKLFSGSNQGKLIVTI